MLSSLRLVAGRRPSASLEVIRRLYATEIPVVSPSTVEESEDQQRARYEQFLASKEKEPPTRPQLDVEVNPNHGLYHFFRQLPEESGVNFNYETVESIEKPGTKMGRSWNATELRRKSFKDLHTLWYICLRERNLLATQREEARRLGIMPGHLDTGNKDGRCRKTMARIKQILNERRLAYEQAYALEYASFKEAQMHCAQEGDEEPGKEGAGNADTSMTDGSETPTRGRRRRMAKKSLATEATEAPAS